MNCPNCGAENDPEARFCAECGTPLEGAAETGGVTIVETPDEDDRTILSSYSSLMAEQAKTVSVTQDDVAAAAAEAEADRFAREEPDPMPSPPPPPSLTTPPGGAGGKNWMSQRNIIIAVVVLLLLCCCCIALIVVGSVLMGEGEFDFEEFNMLPAYLAFI